MKTLEEKWGHFAYQKDAVAVRPEKWLGVNVTSFYNRKRLFWNDLEKLCKEYWGSLLMDSFDRPAYDHIYTIVGGAFGTTLKILFDGNVKNEVEIRMTVLNGDKVLTTQNQTFGVGASLRSMIEWIDGVGVAAARKEGMDQR